MGEQSSFSAMEGSTNCQICIQKFTKTRYPVTCPSCEFVSCGACVSKYHCSKPMHPQCMSCGEVWTSEQVAALLTKRSHLSEVFNSRNDLLLQEQLRLVPQTQPYMEAFVNTEEATCRVRRMAESVKNATKIFQDAKAMEREARRVLRDTQMRLNQLQKSVLDDKSQSSATSRRCFSNFCDGWVREGHACTKCGKSACFKCMSAVDRMEDHLCEKDKLLTASTIRENTKECPTCLTLISKVSGCNDMFCVVCKTTFNYRTGAVDRKGNSNPMFYDWLRSMGVPRPEHLRTIEGHNFTLTHIMNRPLVKRVMIERAKRGLFMGAFNTLDNWIQKIANTGYGEFKQRLLKCRVQCMREGSIEDPLFKKEVSRIHRNFERDQALHYLKETARIFYRRMLDRAFNAEQEHEFHEIVEELQKALLTFDASKKKIKNVYSYTIRV